MGHPRNYTGAVGSRETVTVYEGDYINVGVWTLPILRGRVRARQPRIGSENARARWT
jgi:hypothetical protein